MSHALLISCSKSLTGAYYSSSPVPLRWLPGSYSRIPASSPRIYVCGSLLLWRSGLAENRRDRDRRPLPKIRTSRSGSRTFLLSCFPTRNLFSVYRKNGKFHHNDVIYASSVHHMTVFKIHPRSSSWSYSRFGNNV